MAPFILASSMQTYYPSLEAIHQQTMQLQSEQCKHCGQTLQLVSHGFVRKKQALGQEPQAVGKRVFCSNRHHRTGCGRTMQLVLDSSLRYMHYAGHAVVVFVLLLLTGASITRAYTQATRAQTPRHAYRWLQRLHAQMSVYRSLFHQPPLDQPTAPCSPCSHPHCLRRSLLSSTFAALLARLEPPLCQAYQSQLQQAFL
jgi:hypothetical protein